MLMRNEEIELVLLRSIVERGENCQQAAEAVSRYLWSVPAPAVEVTPVAFALHTAANHCDDLAAVAARKDGMCQFLISKALRNAGKEIREMIDEEHR